MILIFRAALCCLLAAAAPVNAYPHQTSPNHVLFLARAKSIDSALTAYREYIAQLGRHDLDLLQQIALILLEQGMRSEDPEIQLLTLFGAGISLNEAALPVLDAGIHSPQPQLQLIALHFLNHYEDDIGNALLHKALSSNYLLIRLEGVLALAKRKAPDAASQIEALMSKVSCEVLPVFPKLYAILGTPNAIRQLRKMLSHSEEKVRLESVLSAGRYRRDDLLPSIRALSTHHLTAQQEACAWTLGTLKDQKAIPRLQQLAASSPSSSTRLAALQSLAWLNDAQALNALKNAALQEDLFAITALSHLEDCQDTLASLLQHPHFPVRLNASLALLAHRDPCCLPLLKELLIQDPRDLLLEKLSSPGGALNCYRMIPSARQNIGNEALVEELVLAARTEILAKALELPETSFLVLATLLLDQQQNDLVPVVIEALLTLRTPQAVALLKQQQQRAGAPLIRSYCNLALVRLKEEGPYLDQIASYVRQESKRELLRFRPLRPWTSSEENQQEDSPYQLSPDERSRLLLESLETLAQQQNEAGLNLLLDVIQYGNQKNAYALAGLLLRSCS